MKYIEHKKSPYYKLFITLTQWTNQIRNVKTNSFKEYIYKVEAKQAIDFLKENKSFEKYFDLKFGECLS